MAEREAVGESVSGGSMGEEGSELMEFSLDSLPNLLKGSGHTP
jgi:hypothetical protein